MKEIEFHHVFNEAMEYVGGVTCEVEGFRKDIVNVACLMLEDGYEQISFLHKSILEYHAASFVRNSSVELACDFYDIAAEDLNSWEDVLAFLKYMDEFRYGKHYVLKYYPAELEEISLAVSSQNEEDHLRYLEKKLPSFFIETSGTTISAFVVMHSETMFPFYHLLTDLMHEVAEAAMAHASDRDIYNSIRATKTSRTGVLGVNLKAMFDYLNPKGVVSVLIQVQEDIKVELAKFDAIVGAERKKLNILRPEKKS
jgi:hypothetical protein